MKTFRMIASFCLIIMLIGVHQAVLSQKAVSLIPNQSTITIKGTSNLHDWEENVSKFQVNLNLKFSEKEISGIDKVQVILESSSIESENNIMTNKTHDALNVDKFPQIDFKLVSVDNLSSENGKFSGTLVGDVTLAGVTKRISLAFTGLHSGNKINIKGSKELNMNDFKIKPPTAMMGALKTGEAVTITFQLNFQVT